jgi:hypothetical protein
MISGNLSLKHPALRARPEFLAATESVEKPTLVLFDTQASEQLGDAFQESASINQDAAKLLKSNIASYKSAVTRGDSDAEFAEMDKRSETGNGITKRWSALSKTAEEALATTAQLASQATTFLGPVILGNYHQLADGVHKMDFFPQTSKEHLIGYGSNLSSLTGDSYSNRLGTSISGGEVTVDTPLFDSEASAAGVIFVDSQSGMAVIQDLR